MISASQNGRHSATVQMTLIIGDREIEVAQSTPTHLILRTEANLNGRPAELVLTIDGKETRRSIEIQSTANATTRIEYQ